MLNVRCVKKYTIAKYPHGAFYTKPKGLSEDIFKKAASSAVLLAVLESCDGVGTTGPPPVMPDMVTRA